MIVQTSIAEEPYSFVIFQMGRGGGVATRQGSNQSAQLHVHTLHVGRISKHYVELK